MTEEQTTTDNADAAQIRAQALQQFWRTCMDNIVKGGASEREAAAQMLTVAGAYVGKAFGAEGAMQLLGDQALFFGRMAKAKDEAVVEAAEASKH